MLHGIYSFSLSYYALCTSASKVRKFAIASKSVFKFHHQKTSCLPGRAVGARDRAWQMKKVLDREAQFLQQIGGNGRRRVEIKRCVLFAKTNFVRNIRPSTPSTTTPRKPPIP